MLLVMDLSDPDCVIDLVARNAGRTDSVLEVPHDGDSGSVPESTWEMIEDPFRLRLPALLVASKADLYSDPRGRAGDIP